MKPSDINSDRREGWVKVKIYLGPGGSRSQEAADPGERWIRPATVTDVERRGGVRETQGRGHRIVEEPRVDVGGIEDVSATRGILDGHGERAHLRDAVGSNSSGPAVPSVDHDLPGSQFQNSHCRFEGRRLASERRDLDLVSKKRVDEREGHPCRPDPSVRPTVRIGRHVEGGPDAGVTRPSQELRREPTNETRRPPEARAVKVVVAIDGLWRDVGETERAIRSA